MPELGPLDSNVLKAGLSRLSKEKFDFSFGRLTISVNEKNGFELVEKLREKSLLKPENGIFHVMQMLSAYGTAPV